VTPGRGGPGLWEPRVRVLVEGGLFQGYRTPHAAPGDCKGGGRPGGAERGVREPRQPYDSEGAPEAILSFHIFCDSWCIELASVLKYFTRRVGNPHSHVTEKNAENMVQNPKRTEFRLCENKI
jgi:hypothetical protein